MTRRLENSHVFVVALATLVLWVVGLGSPGLAQGGLSLEPVASGFSQPIALTHAGDDRLFVTELAGRVRIVRDGRVLPTPFLDIASRVVSGGERGLLSIAFHPDYQSNGLFFVNYTGVGGRTIIARYQVSSDPDRADPGSEAILFEIDQPFSNHNGGQLQFGPDGMLYIAMGDGGSGNDPFCHGQRPDSLLGKMLRVDVDRNMTQAPFYGVPPDNPFVGAGDPPDEIWALGLRNPWRFSFDRQTGDLFLGDVGQRAREEIDWQPAGTAGGRNYGWKVLEGNLCLGDTSGCASVPGGVPGCGDPGYQAPILDYGHDSGNCSVTGGYVYRGPSAAELVGKYIYGDFCSGTLWAATQQGPNWTTQALTVTASQLSSFGEDAAGDLYLVQLSGTVSKLVSTPAPDPGVIELTADSFSAAESAGEIAISARRAGGSDGAVSVELVTAELLTSEQGAEAGVDYLPPMASFLWQDGETGVRTIVVEVIDDDEVEDDESFGVGLENPSESAVLGARVSAVALILDDDRLTQSCVPGNTVLCLANGRFEVALLWRTAPPGSSPGSGTATEGAGQAVGLTSDSGYFWFFDPENVEVAVKVLNACQDFGGIWVFGAGLTNVEATITVRDSTDGRVKTYVNPLGQPFEPILDIAAFSTCP